MQPPWIEHEPPPWKGGILTIGPRKLFWAIWMISFRERDIYMQQTKLVGWGVQGLFLFYFLPSGWSAWERGTDQNQNQLQSVTSLFLFLVEEFLGGVFCYVLKDSVMQFFNTVLKKKRKERFTVDGV